MTALILFSCTGLLVYWASRVIVIMRGPAGRVDEVLQEDLWIGRRLLDRLQEMFIPVMTA